MHKLHYGTVITLHIICTTTALSGVPNLTESSLMCVHV